MGQPGKRHRVIIQDMRRNPLGAQCAGIKPRKRPRTNDRHILPQPIRPRRGQFRTDQGPGEPPARHGWRRRMQQPIGPDGEKTLRQTPWVGQQISHAFVEGRQIDRIVRHVLRQAAVLGQEGKKFARHGGLEADYFSCADLHPFAMRAGQADDTIEGRCRGQKTGKLGLFTAHHIGGAGLAKPRHDRERDPPIAQARHRTWPHIGGLCRNRAIIHLAQATTPTYHAAGQHRDAPHAQPIADQIKQRRLPGIGGDIARVARACDMGANAAIGTDRPCPLMGIAPIHRDPTGKFNGRAHENPLSLVAACKIIAISQRQGRCLEHGLERKARLHLGNTG